MSKELSIIQDASILSEEKVNTLKGLLPNLLQARDSLHIWRTETEMRVSVLNHKACPDNPAKYHQAKLEQVVFFEQLLQTSLNYEKTKYELTIKETEIDELEEQLSQEVVSYKQKRLHALISIKNIELQEIRFKLKNMEKEATERLREIETWEKIKLELDDGSFDTEDKNTNQLISLTRRYIIEAWNVVNSKGTNDISSIGNIMGQFETMIRECIARGVIEHVLSIFGSDIRTWVIQAFNLK